jgi:hypothetical protein
MGLMIPKPHRPIERSRKTIPEAVLYEDIEGNGVQCGESSGTLRKKRGVYISACTTHNPVP